MDQEKVIITQDQSGYWITTYNGSLGPYGSYQAAQNIIDIRLFNSVGNPYFLKRLRQVRDVLNKCRNIEIIEKIAKLLNI